MDNVEVKNKELILINAVLLTFMACLDGSIVNVALPVMAGYFSVGMNSIAIIVSIYLVTITASILIFGRLGDILGTTKIFMLGTAIFTLGSLLCAISNSMSLLVISRVIQAIGAAAYMATNQGIITRVFPARERGRALGILGSSVALGNLVGPPLGGFIIDVSSWKYIFLINVPIGIFAFVLGLKILPKNDKIVKARFDVKGSLLYVIFIISLFAALMEGEKIGFTSPVIIGSFALSVITIILFVKVEKNEKSPMLELSIFKNRLFSLSIFCGFLLFISISFSNIILPFYFQDAIKLSPAATGMYMMTYPLVLMVVAPISGYISDRIGSELLTFLGLVIFSIGFFLMATLNQNFQPHKFVLYIAVMALGNGLFQSPNNSLIMSTVPRDRLGIAGSINAMVRNLGLVIGITLSTIILYGVMSSRIGYEVTTFINGKEAQFCYAMNTAFAIAGIISLTGAILTAIRLVRKKKSTREDIIEDMPGTSE
jgi:EmrB/QacA subfamily drug resistance transporter